MNGKHPGTNVQKLTSHSMKPRESEGVTLKHETIILIGGNFITWVIVWTVWRRNWKLEKKKSNPSFFQREKFICKRCERMWQKKKKNQAKEKKKAEAKMRYIIDYLKK